MLDIVIIDHFDPSARAQVKAELMNECMAVRRARQGLPKLLDRSVGVFHKHFGGVLREYRAE
jgi:hypothetical protein